MVLSDLAVLSSSQNLDTSTTIYIISISFTVPCRTWAFGTQATNSRWYVWASLRRSLSGCTTTCIHATCCTALINW